MSIISAMFTGASGLQTLSSAIEVISNNIANANTIGFKSGRAEFADLLSQSVGGTSQIGRGVTLDAVSKSFAQGSFQNTSVVTDLAISGAGFFIVSDGSVDYYTRAGEFRLNEDGLLVNPNGLLVQGYEYDSSGVNTGVVGDIDLSNLGSSPNSTTEMTIAANLNSDDPVSAAFDANDPVNTSNFSTSMTVYDSLGNEHTVTIYFSKTADNAWDWNATVDGGEIVSGVAGVLEIEASGTIGFTTDGELDTEVTISSDFDFTGGATLNQNIVFDFGDSITTDTGTGLSGTTQFAGTSAVNFQTQDGYPTGDLQTIQIGEDGVITGIFSNGRTRDIAQIVLATFPNDNGLYSVGGNMFIQTSSSGEATETTPGAGKAGTIASSSLELSNVDLTNEFINMITTQRGFQAASRVITTSDGMLNEVVNLGR